MIPNKWRKWTKWQSRPSGQRPRKRARSYCPRLDPLEDRLLLSSYVVNSLGDENDIRAPLPLHDADAGGHFDSRGNYLPSGFVTLRSALQHISNEREAANTITFTVSGTITVNATGLGGLPTITAPVTIDGTSAPGFQGLPVIELKGSPGLGDGLKITATGFATGSTIKGLAINSFSGNGIYLSSSNGNDIEDCFIGTNAKGTAALGNGTGVRAEGSNNTIGGKMVGAHNVISGNSGIGVRLAIGTGNLVQGNYIGTDATGATTTGTDGKPLGNGGDGVSVQGSQDTIGGTTAAARNVISGNHGFGIAFNSSASSLTVQGNYIGTNATGSAALGNGSHGVDAVGDNNTIGGSAVGARNLISGNAGVGVHLKGKGNLVQGNYIGTDLTGSTTTGTDGKPLGNGSDGVQVEGGGNTIGGTTDAARNVIAGNGRIGIYLNGPGLTGNLVQGNYIGTNTTGIAALGNGGDGVRTFLGSNNTIGGTVPGARNLISGNKGIGVYLGNDGNLLQGNYIGTDVTGSVALGNGDDGVRIDGSQNTIGGTSASARNVISGNKGNGVDIFDIYATKNVVQGNYIGTDAQGLTTTGTDGMPLGNLGDGVSVDGSGNTIGGTAGAGNVIAGNQNDGVLIIALADGAAQANLVQGNYIGTDVTGAKPLGNAGNGVEINGAGGNHIGVGPGPDNVGPGPANLISGNGRDGILIMGGPGGNTVQSNYIGTDATGLTTTATDGKPLGNQANGVEINASPSNLIGAGPGPDNVISGNAGDGIVITGPAALENTVQGNYIGIDVKGANALGNRANGVEISGGAGGNFIGLGPEPENVISGNKGDGVFIMGGPGGNILRRNYIGTDAQGLTMTGTDGKPLGNLYGVEIKGAAKNVIGLGPGPDNVISGNALDGIIITGLAALGNTVQGNYIGIDVTGAKALGNQASGVEINDAGGNSVGIRVPGSSRPDNVISGNGEDGVLIKAGPGGNNVQSNYIGTDATGLTTTGTDGKRLGNLFSGVEIRGASRNSVGVSVPGLIGPDNVISGNLDGVLITADPLFMTGAGGNNVQSNYIGTDVTGTKPLGNRANGVEISGVSGNFIGAVGPESRNLISGNEGNGVVITGKNNTVQSNYIGTDLSGAAALGNAQSGVMIEAGGNTVGGLLSLRGNVISGNKWSGVEIHGDAATLNVIQGNKIGTDANGSVALPNMGEGIDIRFAQANTVGGTAAAERNIISGNGRNGVSISGANNVVQGNYIGTDERGVTMTGTDGKPLGNTGSGVEIDGTVDDYAKNNTIGGAVAGAGNVISGNGGDGVMLVLDATRNWIMGNYIGTDLSGLIGLGNAGHGVELLGASNNTIGGTVLGAGNTIAFNGKDGVLVDRRVSSGNAIQRNAIFSHSFGLGIELANGANNDQPIPILTSVSSGGGTVTIQGVVQGFAPNTSYTLELFADTKCNPSGFGEGERYLGSVTVMTDDSGNATFTAMFSVAVPDGQFVSATATDPNGNTSQFAPCLQVPSPTPPPPGNAPRWLLEPAAVAAVLASFLDPRAASADAANCLTESVLTRQNSVPPQPEVDLYFAGLNADQLGDSHDRSSCSPPPSSWASCGF